MCLRSQSAVSGQSRVTCRDFLELWPPKKREKIVFLADNVTRNFLEGEENENPRLEDLPQADFGRVHENIFLVGKEKVNN